MRGKRENESTSIQKDRSSIADWRNDNATGTKNGKISGWNWIWRPKERSRIGGIDKEKGAKGRSK